jgi:DUF2934 family protein
MRTKTAPSAKHDAANPTGETRLPVASVGTEPCPDGRPVIPEAAIRQLAYRKWEAAGRPSGDGVNFWLEAERGLAQAQWAWREC